jgi:hypothetical protein
MNFTCPVCGYPELTELPRTEATGGSYEICPSCGFEFGYSDEARGFSYEQWREAWIAQGTPWRGGSSIPRPKNWNPSEQLKRIQ